jgi:hypothetical protein
MPDLTLINCRTHPLDGIEYMLSVYGSRAEYTGFWECGNCHDEGGIERGANSREETIERCIKAIERHHAHNHSACKLTRT